MRWMGKSELAADGVELLTGSGTDVRSGRGDDQSVESCAEPESSQVGGSDQVVFSDKRVEESVGGRGWYV